MHVSVYWEEKHSVPDGAFSIAFLLHLFFSLSTAFRQIRHDDVCDGPAQSIAHRAHGTRSAQGNCYVIYLARNVFFKTHAMSELDIHFLAGMSPHFLTINGYIQYLVAGKSRSGGEGRGRQAVRNHRAQGFHRPYQGQTVHD